MWKQKLCLGIGPRPGMEMADLLEDAYTLSYKDGAQVGMTAQGWHFYWENQRFTVEKAS